MDLNSRVLLFVCCVVVGPASAEPVPVQTAPDGAVSSGMTLETGVKVGSGGRQGRTAMHWMAFNGNEAAVRELIISGADINGRVKTGSTPLHLAAYNGHAAVAKLLIEHGAKVNARTKAGITPLDWARRNGHEEVTLLLIAHGGKKGKGLPAKTADPAGSVGTSGKTEAPRTTFGRRPRAPLKYALLQAPEDIPDDTEDPKKGTVARDKPPETGVFRIQLGAFGSEQAALDAWARYRKKHPGALGSRELIAEKVSVNQKVYHRVQTGPMSRANASAICSQLKQVDQPCLVIRR